MTQAMRRAGLAAVLLYAAVAVVTHSLAPGGFRPLFDGFAPPEPYRWVNPPPERVRDNQPPASAEQDIPLNEAGNQVSNVTTADAQAIAGMEAGMVPPHPPDTAVRLRLTPVDAGTLAPLPPGQSPLSNAYQVTLLYQPSQTLVTQLAREGTIALTGASTGDKMFFSADGTQWEERPSRPYGDTHGRFTPFHAPGFYVVGGVPVPPTPAFGGGSDDPNTVLLVLVAAIPILGAIAVLRPPAPVPVGHSGSRGTRQKAGRADPRRKPAPPRKRPPAGRAKKKRS